MNSSAAGRRLNGIVLVTLARKSRSRCSPSEPSGPRPFPRISRAECAARRAVKIFHHCSSPHATIASESVTRCTRNGFPGGLVKFSIPQSLSIKEVAGFPPRPNLPMNACHSSSPRAGRSRRGAPSVGTASSSRSDALNHNIVLISVHRALPPRRQFSPESVCMIRGMSSHSSVTLSLARIPPLRHVARHVGRQARSPVCRCP